MGSSCSDWHFSIYTVVLCSGQVHVLVFTFSYKCDSLSPALCKVSHAHQHEAFCLILAQHQVQADVLKPD